MTRIIFPKNKQSIWLGKIAKKSQLSNSELAEICGISSKTFRDWRREKFLISKDALTKLSNKFDESIPEKIKEVDNYWYIGKGARKGALRRLELYGPPGTVEGRKKGGRNSQKNRRLHPELYPNCILRKNYIFPKKSKELAELVGIILGDGGITNSQIKISLNKVTEPEYVEYVSRLMATLFTIPPAKYFFKGRGKNVCVLCFGGVALIEYLLKIGLKTGNKVLRQVGVPNWILINRTYSVACLRGLVDTDGCIYSHKHITQGFPCLNYGLTFTNYSKPLLDFAYDVLLREGFTPKLKKHGVYLYRQNEVKRYFDIIGSSNNLHYRELEIILKKKDLL